VMAEPPSAPQSGPNAVGGTETLLVQTGTVTASSDTEVTVVAATTARVRC